MSMHSFAQELDKEWFSGKIYLVNGGMIEGLLQVDLQKDFILVKKANRLQTFNAQQVEYVDYVDHVESRIRSYYSLIHRVKHREKHMFFELLKQGDVSLLSREKYVTDYGNLNRSFYSSSRSRNEPVPKEEYYILDKNNRLQLFTGEKNQLLTIMQDNHKAMEKFISSEKLQMDRRVDLLKIFYYYHHLKELQVKEADSEES
ncbi:hypothetical protein Q0590_21815 [Rhodocytophaga aerolata]|uniref:Uncharacterized protein n=1 Tax=Rhodocytophaga aerolata TaxID=455078 RepID=A0ABT8RDZ8_9BACT|nr:hypothetical protein [Rhodocytophaga aerolata]MDO1448930.1 hypothetical protein [Rhodocytophaga aerolata]